MQPIICMDKNVISLSHGSGGLISRELVEGLFLKRFHNNALMDLEDASILNLPMEKIAFTTDSFVVNPIFFPGGDIGRLAVCGTVNDLSMMGAKPLYLSVGFIIEEGFLIEDLKKIVDSMGEAAEEAEVSIVCGDTKVVERNAADNIFINTAGIGVIPEDVDISVKNAVPGDVIIVNGNIGDHGIAVLSQRKGLHFKTYIKSDVAPLNGLTALMIQKTRNIHTMRDPTRGGLATTLKEIAIGSNVGIEIDEERIPVSEGVRKACELLGLDWLYLANEGKAVVVVPEEEGEQLIETMKRHPYGEGAKIIGRVVPNSPGIVTMRNAYGVRRVIEMLAGEQYPRIC
ncbi:MAG: hydrogenase expression/formation protein HypE [Syntrophorhabdaceae bacterium]|nr:hydrogenase expression/formation protein HypE [Syntrophorhabdaceae bacterium]